MKINEYFFSEIEEILKWPEWKINLLYFENLKCDLRKELIEEKKRKLDIVEETSISKIIR